MQALISLGQPARAMAMEQYGQFRERPWEEFQIAPSEQVEQIYGICRGNQGKDDILKMVTEEESDSHQEDARIVAKRIDRAFRKAYSHSRACLSFRTATLEADKELAVENLPQAMES